MDSKNYGWDAPAVGDRDETGTANSDVGRVPLRIGFIGLGNMGRYSLGCLVERPGIVVAAMCDVDARHLRQAAETVRERQGGADCLRFRDFRELNRCPDIDAVIISTPDHWHALQGIDAMLNGKDAYIEKPLTLTVPEGRALCRTAEQTRRICQTGSQQRSSREFRFACELIRNGVIGTVREVNVTIPPNNREAPTAWSPMPVPESLDYDLWLGPAPLKPYHELRCHYCFRFIGDYSGGQMTNWGAHTLDIVQWALDADASGPVRVKGRGVYPAAGLFDTAAEVDVEWTYADGARVRCTTGKPQVEFVGSVGRIEVGRGHISAEPASILEARPQPGAVRLYRSDDHYENFFDCVRSRRQPVCPPEVGHRAATVAHIGNIAMRLGRELQWDPQAERFVGDDQANALLSRPMRAPWSLPAEFGGQ